MILIGRGLNQGAGVSGGEGSTRSRKIPKKAEARSSVQVNSDCAVVKVRIKEVSGRKKLGRGWRKRRGSGSSNEAETGRTKAEGGKSDEGTGSGGGTRDRSNKAERESGGQEAQSRNRKRRGRMKVLKQGGRERRSEDGNQICRTRLK